MIYCPEMAASSCVHLHMILMFCSEVPFRIYVPQFTASSLCGIWRDSANSPSEPDARGISYANSILLNVWTVVQ